MYIYIYMIYDISIVEITELCISFLILEIWWLTPTLIAFNRKHFHLHPLGADMLSARVALRCVAAICSYRSKLECFDFLGYYDWASLHLGLQALHCICALNALIQ